MNDFHKQQKEFYEKLEEICNMLDTCHGQYTDSDPGGQTLTTEDDVRVYNKIDLLIQNSQSSDHVKNELRIIQRKIREAYLLAKDLGMLLAMYD